MSAPINTKQKPSRQCPCGCGTALYPYNDGRPLVCPEMWKQVPSKDRKIIMLPGHSLAERRAACRRVLELARRIKAGAAASISDFRFEISKRREAMNAAGTAFKRGLKGRMRPKRRCNFRRPCFTTFYWLGIEANQWLTPVSTYTDIAREVGLSKQNTFTACMVALGKVVFAMRAAVPDGSNSHNNQAQ